MRRGLLPFMITFLLAGTVPLHGQDLNRLRGRVTALWKLRSQVPPDKSGALAFIEPPTQNAFLQSNEPPIMKFEVTGLEFNADPKRVDVLVKARIRLPKLGEIDNTVRETWVW